MSLRERLALSGMLLISGCLYHARERTDQTVANMVNQPFDIAPEGAGQTPAVPPGPATKLDTKSSADQQVAHQPASALDVQTTAYMQEAAAPEGSKRAKFEPKIPPELPGSEAPSMKLPENAEAKQRAIQQMFPELKPLPTEPPPVAGPNGRPYTLADLQELAAANSPDLRQAASDVEAARGNLIQARTYQNPTVSLQMGAANDASQTSEWGVLIDQKISTAGKMKLASAAAEMDLRNAELALRRARFDLATRVRNAYYALLVAKETARVNRALASFTDQIYRLHVGMLQAQAGNIAPYEPMALRAQASSARLIHATSIQAYMYTWKQLVASIGLRQLPLSQVDGRIDQFIPLYNFDTVLDHVLRNHTDVLMARNGIDKARYQLKLAQVTPIPDVDVNFMPANEFAVFPRQFFNTAGVSIPFPIWDKNKGTIIAAEAAMVRATEEPHRVELNLTNNLAGAYETYKTSLQGLDSYRHDILPDQVRTYRGVLERRQLDVNSQFADLFTAQQTLAGFVSMYLTTLSNLWTSAISVADLLQTDDLFQLAEKREVPPLPDLEHLPALPCCHPGVVGFNATPVEQVFGENTPHSSPPSAPSVVQTQQQEPSGVVHAEMVRPAE